MHKSEVLVMVVAFAVFAQGMPQSSLGNEELVKAALSRNWDEVHRILDNFHKTHLPLSMSSSEVRHLKPIPNGRFYAEAEAAFHHAVNDNGKVDEQSGGHKVINNNGKVQEYDFKPQGPAYFHV